MSVCDPTADVNELDWIHHHKAAKLDSYETPDKIDRRKYDFEVMILPRWGF